MCVCVCVCVCVLEHLIKGDVTVLELRLGRHRLNCYHLLLLATGDYL